jgi:hypothetical protein
MMNMFRIQIVLLVSLILVSCGKKQETVIPAPPQQQKTFEFTQTNTIVSASELEGSENANKALKADFNLDGLSDLAIIRTRGNAQSEVDIYIQKKTDATTAQDSGEASFFRGGTISRPNDGKISGLVSSANKKMVNIILLITYSNRPNEMIQYQNDGASFTEVPF